MDGVFKKRACALAVLALITGLIWTLPSNAATEEEPYLLVHFLDVGQGDAAFIQTKEGVQILIDGGRDGKALAELQRILGPFDRTLDMIVATHGDLDHIGGLVDVLTYYEVESILTTENKGESDTAELFESLKHKEGAEIILARRGQEFLLGSSTELAVLFPETDVSKIESNASSIVLKLTHGENTFLFTGDAPKSTEEYLVLTEGEYLESDVLKVGHHGSRTSSSELFLDEVAPQFAIISAAEGNSYGHPHVEVTDALFNRGIEMLETGKEGTITFLSDGIALRRRE
jgi:competence protein ComEC